MHLDTAPPVLLPAEVLDQLAPVLASLDSEVQASVAVVARRKVEHAGKVFVRANGGVGDYERGFNAIVRDVFERQSSPVLTSSDDDDEDSEEEATERTCECTACDDGSCDGGCDACENYDCSQCHNLYSCCGYCDSCSTCHSDHDFENYIHTNSDGVVFCTSCIHFCND